MHPLFEIKGRNEIMRLYRMWAWSNISVTMAPGAVQASWQNNPAASAWCEAEVDGERHSDCHCLTWSDVGGHD